MAGALPDFSFSGFARQQSNGRLGYRITAADINSRVHPVVDIFESANCNEVLSVDDQRVARRRIQGMMPIPDWVADKACEAPNYYVFDSNGLWLVEANGEIEADLLLTDLPMSPRMYMDGLETLAEDLPTGARRFATYADHYTPTLRGVQWLGDAQLRALTMDEVVLRLHRQKGRHLEDLAIAYQGVSSYSVRVNGKVRSGGLGKVLVDQLLPCEKGVAHHIELTGGSISVESRDIQASWVDVVG